MNRMRFKICPICDGRGSIYERTLDEIKLVRCSECFFVYANLSAKEIERANFSFGERRDAEYEHFQTGLDRAWFSRIAGTFNIKYLRRREKKVLDIGCGNGLLLSEFKKLGWKCYGIDPSPWAGKHAKIIGYKLFRKDLLNSKLPANFFDLVVCTSTLEHIEKPGKFIVKTYRLLKSGGMAYFAGVPNYGSLPIRLRLANFEGNKPPYHVGFFNRQSLELMLKKNNFDSYSIGSYGIPGIYRIYMKLPKNKRKQANKTKPSIFKIVLYKLLVALNYAAGKLFYLGDKLEIIIEKK